MVLSCTICKYYWALDGMYVWQLNKTCTDSSISLRIWHFVELSAFNQRIDLLNMALARAVLWYWDRPIVKCFPIWKDILFLSSHFYDLMLWVTQHWFGCKHPRLFVWILPWPDVQQRVDIVLRSQAVRWFGEVDSSMWWTEL